MKKEELKIKLEKLSFIRIVGKLQLISLLAFIINPFVYILYSEVLAFKIGLTGLIGMIIFCFIDLIFKKAVKKVIDQHKEPITKTKSKFQERLDQFKIGRI